MSNAEINQVQDPNGTRVLTLSTAIIFNFFVLVPLFLILAGIGVVAAAVYLVHGPDAELFGIRAIDTQTALVVITFGAGVALASGYWGLRHTNALGGRYLRR